VVNARQGGDDRTDFTDESPLCKTDLYLEIYLISFSAAASFGAAKPPHR
jgi:hypothetical protein